MDADGSVTRYIQLAKVGGDDAERQIWTRYYERLVRLARHKLGRVPKRVLDEEDVVVEVLREALEGIRQDRFAKMEDREDLWQVLALMTSRRAANQRRFLLRLKRGGGKAISDSAAQSGEMMADFRLANVTDPSLEPQAAAALIENFRILRDGLPDETVRSVLELKLAGFGSQEIAVELDVTVRTVERKLALIRRHAARVF